MFGLIIDRPVATVAFVLATLAATTVVAFALARRLAVSDFLMDAPSGRSNHRRPTARSGGVAVFLAWLLACYALSFLGRQSPWPAAFGAFASVAIPAFLLGLADDWRPISASRRLFYQVAVASMFALTFGALEVAPSPFGGTVELGVFGPVLTVFWIVAFMNAYNFMDGANGLAGFAGLVGACAIAVGAGLGGDGSTALLALALAAAILGFLPVNFPSGRIFLGDGGSMSIGFALAALAVMAARIDGALMSPLFAPIVFMPLLFDVALTLVSRGLRGQRLSEAHSEHAYQVLIRSGLSHAKVATLYFALTAMCAICAFAALRLPAQGQWAVVIVVAIALAPAHLGLQALGVRRGLIAVPAGRPAWRTRRRRRRTTVIATAPVELAAASPGFRNGDLHADESDMAERGALQRAAE